MRTDHSWSVRAVIKIVVHKQGDNKFLTVLTIRIDIQLMDAVLMENRASTLVFVPAKGHGPDTVIVPE